MEKNNNARKEITIPHVLFDYLQELRKEMHSKIEKAFRLSLYKLVSLGIIIVTGILIPETIARKEVALTYCIFIALVVVSFDFLIANNYRLINTTGYLIRERIEKQFEDHFNLALVESEAFIFPALMNRVTEIGISFFAIIYALVKIPSNFSPTILFSVKIILVIFLILSSINLIKSRL